MKVIQSQGVNENLMKEDLETVKSLARDLREDKESPRSPREKLVVMRWLRAT